MTAASMTAVGIIVGLGKLSCLPGLDGVLHGSLSPYVDLDAETTK